MKYKADRPLADPEAAARKLLELANAFEPMQDGRIYIEKINEGHVGRIQGWPGPSHRQWLALAVRERRLCEAHRGRCGDLCVILPAAVDSTCLLSSAKRDCCTQSETYRF
jgi:hypothetical protein